MTESEKRAQAQREQLQALAAPGWDLVADEKLSFIVSRYRSGGARASRLAARRMMERWARLHPGGSSPEARESDLEHHRALRQKLDRTAHVIARR